MDVENPEIKQEENTPPEVPESQPQDTPQEPPKDSPQEPPKPEDTPEDDVKTLVEQAGLNFDTFQDEFEADGNLSEESYKKLEAAGFPPHIVDAHVEGLKATQELEIQNIHNSVGGEENLNQILSWAGQHLEETEIDAFNELAVSGEMSQFLLALNGIKAQYEASEGPLDITSYSGTPQQSATDVFTSMDELTNAMSDPRYHSDPVYRDEVSRKLERSPIY